MKHKLIDLPVHLDSRGRLGFAQEGDHIPFPVKRIFFLYDIPVGTIRAAHAHRAQHQFLLMLSGACRAKVDNGIEHSLIYLESPQVALYLPPLIWLEIDEFVAQSICLVLTSDFYDETDYVRKYDEFRLLTGSSRSLE